MYVAIQHTFAKAVRRTLGLAHPGYVKLPTPLSTATSTIVDLPLHGVHRLHMITLEYLHWDIAILKPDLLHFQQLEAGM